MYDRLCNEKIEWKQQRNNNRRMNNDSKIKI